MLDFLLVQSLKLSLLRKVIFTTKTRKLEIPRKISLLIIILLCCLVFWRFSGIFSFSYLSEWTQP